MNTSHGNEDRLTTLRAQREQLKERYRLHMCDDGSFDVRDTEVVEESWHSPGYDYHNLGSGRDPETAWSALFAEVNPDTAKELAELEKAAGERETDDLESSAGRSR